MVVRAIGRAKWTGGADESDPPQTEPTAGGACIQVCQPGRPECTSAGLLGPSGHGRGLTELTPPRQTSWLSMTPRVHEDTRRQSTHVRIAQYATASVTQSNNSRDKTGHDDTPTHNKWTPRSKTSNMAQPWKRIQLTYLTWIFVFSSHI